MSGTQFYLTLEVPCMKRQPFEVAASVFAFSVATELLCIRVLRGSRTEWLRHPHRLLLFFSMILVNLLNAAAALYFSSRAVRAEVRLKLGEQESVYLNHHLRQALSIVETASFLTNDEQKQVKIVHHRPARPSPVAASRYNLESEIRQQLSKCLFCRRHHTEKLSRHPGLVSNEANRSSL